MNMNEARYCWGKYCYGKKLGIEPVGTDSAVLKEVRHDVRCIYLEKLNSLRELHRPIYSLLRLSDSLPLHDSLPVSMTKSAGILFETSRRHDFR